ncbi:PEP-CTERM sorting domain-containing protein, partial [bacterium]|nr:PEP-CTERM sorting domain-containing protein [bacterium]
LGFMNSANAGYIGWNFSWTGDNTYGVTGFFATQDTVDTIVRENELISFFAEISDNSGVLETLGKNDLSNFNFNSSTGQFRVGGRSNSNDGQRWNALSGSAGYGLQSGRRNTFIKLNGGNSLRSASRTDPEAGNFAVTNVPAPAPLALLGLGLAAMAWRRRAS